MGLSTKLVGKLRLDRNTSLHLDGIHEKALHWQGFFYGADV
jgi:hypothetical protein